MKKFKLGDRVEVIWLDAASHTGGWKDYEEMLERDLLPVKTVGYCAFIGKEKVIVAQNWAKEQGLMAEAMVIPASCVVKIRKVK